MAAFDQKRLGLTLMELLVVLVILAAVAGMVVPMLGDTSEDARRKSTLASLQALRDAIARYSLDMKGVLVGDSPGTPSTGMPATLLDLQRLPDKTPTFEPATGRGWRGPYLQGTTGKVDFTNPKLDSTSFGKYGFKTGDATFLDGWGNPIVLQSSDVDHARLVSAGPPTKGTGMFILETAPAKLMPTTAERGNDIIVFLRTQDLYP